MLLWRETYNRTATPDPEIVWNSSYRDVAQAWVRAGQSVSGVAPTSKGIVSSAGSFHETDASTRESLDRLSGAI